MHPFLRSLRQLSLYLAAWILIGLALAALLALWRDVPFTIALMVMGPSALFYGLVCLSALWVARSLPFDRTPAPRLMTSLFGACVQASGVWVGLSAPWVALMSRLDILVLDRPQVFAGLGGIFVIGVPLYAVSLALHYLMLAFEASREAERRVLESQVSAREAEVRALRAQLNPHFLFNSLNSINALIGSDPEAARRMCESLGDFLRRTLALGSRDAVTVSEELELVERYLAIEQVRFGSRLAIERQVAPAAAACLVPPLLLQPLVENAVKHGIADRLEGGTIWLTADLRDQTLQLEVENDADDAAPGRAGEGVGLQNVKRRLDALSARDARLDARRTAGRFRVTLTLPARTAPRREDGHGRR
jgi:hypothetical protein